MVRGRVAALAAALSLAVPSLVTTGAGCGPRDGDGGVGDADAGEGPFGAPFGPPALIAELEDPLAQDDDPTVSADELEIFFNSDRDGASHVWRAVRAAAADPFGTPALVVELAGANGETTPELAPGGLAMNLATDLGAGGNLDLHVATRASPGDPFGALVPLPALSSPFTDDGAAVSPDELEIVFASTRMGALDLWRAVRTAAGDPWPAPSIVAELSTDGPQGAPALSNDGLVLYFHGVTSAPGDPPGIHLWRAARLDRAAAFGAPALVPELVSAATDLDPHLTPDGRAIYFASDRSGSYALYVARR